MQEMTEMDSLSYNQAYTFSLPANANDGQWELPSFGDI